jgi:hypothetical protein
MVLGLVSSAARSAPRSWRANRNHPPTATHPTTPATHPHHNHPPPLTPLPLPRRNPDHPHIAQREGGRDFGGAFWARVVSSHNADKSPSTPPSSRPPIAEGRLRGSSGPLCGPFGSAYRPDSAPTVRLRTRSRTSRCASRRSLGSSRQLTGRVPQPAPSSRVSNCSASVV